MNDDKDAVKLRLALGISGAIITLLLTALCIVLWADRNNAWMEIARNNQQITDALKDIASLRLEMATTLATKSDVKELGDKVDHVVENQQTVAVELAVRQKQDGDPKKTSP